MNTDSTRADFIPPDCRRCQWKHGWYVTEGPNGKWEVTAGPAGDQIIAFDLPDRGVAAYIGFQLAERVCLERQLDRAHDRIAELEAELGMLKMGFEPHGEKKCEK